MITQNQPKVVISVLNWNNYQDTITCVEALKLLDYPNYQIVITDNASVNNSVEVLKAKFADIQIIENKENVGYAAGHHVAIKQAITINKADAVWILNNDALADANSLTALVNDWQTNGIGLYGSVTIDHETDGNIVADTIQYAGGYEIGQDGNVQTAQYNIYKGKQYSTLPQNGPRKVADLHGASILLPADVYNQFGFMAEDFFLYAEETDYCFRLMANKVFCYVVNNSVIVHNSSASMRTHKRLRFIKAYYSNRNFYIFLKNNTAIFTETVNYFYSFRTWRNMIKFFLKYYVVGNSVWRHHHQNMYYENLGKIHALMGKKGKYLDPNNFLN